MMIFGNSLLASSQEYFQQEVNFKIHVSLNDKRHALTAFETVEYINNSPDTLNFLYFHLWPNAYANNKTELANQLLSWKGKEKLFNDIELKGFIDSLDFKVNEQKVEWYLMPGQPDICHIRLTDILKPGDTIQITTPFHVKIPKGVTSRLGHIGESYQISQWYPKPAVYDRAGWHQMPYLDQGEFYSEFGSFDVSITLPDNYIVGASGDLQDISELEIMNKLAADTSWKSTLGYARDYFPPSSKQMKTLRYTGSQIHDFAWFADKRFHIMKGNLNLPYSGREITTWIMFTNQQAVLWKDALEYVNSAIKHFSEWIGDYPYNTFTAVQSALTAGDGMEYPGITVIGMAEDGYDLDEVIAHEVCHSWFYSAIGSDERRYPFMDEGITSAYEMRYMNERYPGKKLWEVYFKNRKLAKFLHIDKLPVQRMSELDWLVQARRNLEQPINLPSPDYSFLNYTDILYYKAAQGFNYMRAYLGDSVFDSIMHDYYSGWKSKHPQPDDLRNIFESHTDKDLAWFFNDFLGTTKRIDYKVVRLENQHLLVKNRGEMVSPFIIAGMNGDSICFEKWEAGFKGEKWIDIPTDNYSEIKINSNHVIPELYSLNNNIRKSGIFRKSDPINPQLLFSVEDPDKRPLMYIPVVNWSTEDGFMIGITANNGFLISKPFEYYVMPFFSFKNSGPAGYGRIAFNISPYDNFIRMVTLSLEGTQFGAPGDQNYRMTKAGLDLYFRNIKMNNAIIHKTFGNFITASDLFQIEQLEKGQIRTFLQLGYVLEKPGLINPFKILTSFESNRSFQKTAVEINYKYSYHGRNNGLDLRLFAGVMLKNNSGVPFYALSASGRSGREQYLYQGSYPDRFGVFPATFWSRQMTVSEGGLVSPVNDSLGYSSWLISANFTSNLPGKAGLIPVKPFINLLLNDHGLGMGHNSPFFWEAGLKTGLWNFFEIYVPLVVSGNISSMRESIKGRIRIVFNLDSFYNLRLNSRLGN